MRHIVSVADVRQTAILHISEALQQREIVSQRLARMLQIAERVNHRDTGVLRHAFDGLLRERAQHNHIHPALQVVRHVAQRFARAEAFLRLVDEHRRTAQARHCLPRTSTGFAKKPSRRTSPSACRRAPCENQPDATSSFRRDSKLRLPLPVRDRESRPDPDTRTLAALSRQQPPFLLAHDYSTLTPSSALAHPPVAIYSEQRLTDS